MTTLYYTFEFYTFNLSQFRNNLLLFIGKCMLLDKTYTTDQEPKGKKVKGQFTSLHRSVIHKSVSKIQLKSK